MSRRVHVVPERSEEDGVGGVGVVRGKVDGGGIVGAGRAIVNARGVEASRGRNGGYARQEQQRRSCQWDHCYWARVAHKG